MREEGGEEKFSFLKWAKGLIFNRLFICFVSWLCLTVWVIGKNHGGRVETIAICAFAGVTVIWMLYEAWKKFIERGEFKANVNVGGRQ